MTTTAANIILLRAGLLDESRYLKGLAAEIGELERRPAHLTQSAEESSLDAWLEKYDYYRLPARSISYYNKGNLLGVLLDLQVREATHDSASIRDVFHWMNENYARKGQYFPDTDGVRHAAEAVSHADLGWFFQKYVAGTEEIPWDDFFKNVDCICHRARPTLPMSDSWPPGTSTLRWWCLQSRREAPPNMPAWPSGMPFWRSTDRRPIAGSPHLRSSSRVIPFACVYATQPASANCTGRWATGRKLSWS